MDATRGASGLWMAPHIFGATYSGPRAVPVDMDADAIDDAVSRTEAPTGRPREVLTVADAPPPEPLQATLERLPGLADDVVLVQVNDRAPQHLYPKLSDRGYEYDTVDVDDAVVTVVWRP